MDLLSGHSPAAMELSKKTLAQIILSNALDTSSHFLYNNIIVISL